MEFAITKISTKGQIVIPIHLRKGIEEGDEFLIVKDNGRIIIKNMKNLAKDLKEDLIFAKKVEKAWQDYDKGKFISMSANKFLEKLSKC